MKERKPFFAAKILVSTQRLALRRAPSAPDPKDLDGKSQNLHSEGRSVQRVGEDAAFCSAAAEHDEE